MLHCVGRLQSGRMGSIIGQAYSTLALLVFGILSDVAFVF